MSVFNAEELTVWIEAVCNVGAGDSSEAVGVNECKDCNFILLSFSPLFLNPSPTSFLFVLAPVHVMSFLPFILPSK
jgi:hypothetical protein